MSTGVETALAAINKDFMEMYASGDAAGIAALYTDDGQLLPPNSEILVGHEAVAGFWQFVMGLGITTLRLETVELEVHGDAAIEIGRYTLAGGGGHPVDSGKYLVVWRNEAGAWKLHRDIWNTSRPLAG